MAPNFVHGKGTRIYANGFGLSTVMRESNFDQSAEAHDVTVYGDGDDRVYIPGTRDGSLSMSGLHDGSTAETDRKLKALAGSSALVATIGFGGDTAGGLAHLINGHITNYTVSSPAGDVVAASAAVQFSSQHHSGRWLAARASRATATTHPSVALPGSTLSTRGAIAHLHVFSKTTGAGNDFVAKVQDSSNGSVWADLLTFATVDSTSIEGSHERVKVAGAVHDNARVVVTTQNSTGVEYAVALARI